LLLNHDENEVVGSADNGLELYVDEYGVAFRFRFPDTPRGREAKTLTASGMCEGMSIGFDRMRIEYKEIEGETVILLHDGRLNEISLLRSGAVANAYAEWVEAKNCGPSLRDDCLQLPMHLLTGGAYVIMMRAMRGLRDAL
jgi:HK97 family phage prohead protease